MSDCNCGETMEGYHTGECSIFSAQNYNSEPSNDSKTPKPINQHNELLAKIEQYQNYTTESSILIDALRAVVELEVPTTFGTDVSTHTAWLDGYNYRKEQDLQAIEGEVK